MKSETSYPAPVTKRSLAACLAALVAMSGAPLWAQAVTTDASDDEEVVRLSPFQVASDKDYGYIKTNSLTATRIGARIMDTPLQVQVLSEDFIRDTGLDNINDVLRYAATSAGDTMMGILQPATGFTPSGNFTTRGFPINARLKNSVRRYTIYSLDNIERVELVRGPASVFFGQAFPGGVINYISKQAEFRNLPTEFSYRRSAWGGNKATYDQNTVLLKDKIAFRNFISWENSSFERDFERRRGFTVQPQMKIRYNDKLEARVEFEYTERKENLAARGWLWADGWFDAYKNPSEALMNAAGINPMLPTADRQALYRTRIQGVADGGGYSNWITDVRNAAGNQNIARYQASSFNKGVYRDLMWGAGAKSGDPRDFNPWGPGSTTDEEVTNLSITVDFRPFEWLTTKYTYNWAHAYYFERKSEARPNADGETFNVLPGLVWRFYDVDPTDHILDNIISFETFGFKNKILFGGIHRAGDNQFGGSSPAPATGANVAGAPNGTNFEGIPGVGNAGAFGLQALRDRAGNLMTALEVFTRYDPTLHVFPDIARITERERPVIDRYRPRNSEVYLSYQGAFFNDRLNVMAGYREEKTYNRQQQLRSNPPWYDTLAGADSSNMLELITPAQYAVYDISEAYQRSLLGVLEGDSQQYGATFAITPEINVYAGKSTSYLPNGGFKAIYNETTVRQRAVDLGRNPDTEVARIRAQGSDSFLSNEEGVNEEIGVKTTLFDNKIVATVALFRTERTSLRVDDVEAQRNEPLNYTASGIFSNQVRWFSADARQRTEGLELEVIWTPNRNYQAVFSYGNMWTAKVVANPAVAPDNINYSATFDLRLANAPKTSVNLWNKYTFTDGPLAGFTVGGGLRHRSEIVISQSRDWDPRFGGATAGDYTVFDLLLGYNTEIWGIRTAFNLNVTNLTDKFYSEGGWNYNAGREIALTTRVSF